MYIYTCIPPLHTRRNPNVYLVNNEFQAPQRVENTFLIQTRCSTLLVCSKLSNELTCEKVYLANNVFQAPKPREHILS